MGQILHKQATTTYAIRLKIQKSEGTLRELAKKFNVSTRTIQKWKSRDSVKDLPMGNGRANSVLTSEEEKIICELRRKSWLSLDDLFDILKPNIPKLSRSNLHRCLQFHGISRVPKEFSPKRERGRFRNYEIGFLHIDITGFWLQKRKCNLFVAIDRVTKLCFAKVYSDKTMKTSLEFLKKVYKFFPYKVHRILTDNGLQFTYRSLPEEKKPKRKHPFTQLCQEFGTKHKLTKFFSPQTNGQVERMNRTIKDATIKMFYYDNIDQFKENLENFLNWYNFEKKLKTLQRRSPYDFTKEKYKQNPKLFHRNIVEECEGLNN